MKKGTQVITHDGCMGRIHSETGTGYIVTFRNNKEKHYTRNQVRPFNIYRDKSYLQIEAIEKMMEEANKYTTDYANGMAAAYAIALNLLKSQG